MFYGYQSSIILAFMNIHFDIHVFLWISILISMDFYGYPFWYPWIFMAIHFGIHRFLWISTRISMDNYGYLCIDFVWILDPGSRIEVFRVIVLTSLPPRLPERRALRHVWTRLQNGVSRLWACLCAHTPPLRAPLRAPPSLRHLSWLRNQARCASGPQSTLSWKMNSKS